MSSLLLALITGPLPANNGPETIGGAGQQGGCVIGDVGPECGSRRNRAKCRDAGDRAGKAVRPPATPEVDDTMAEATNCGWWVLAL